MTMRTGHACTAPASRVLEGYTTSHEGLVRGDLKIVAYVCEGHAVDGRRSWMPDLNVFDALAESPAGHACGEIHHLKAARQK